MNAAFIAAAVSAPASPGGIGIDVLASCAATSLRICAQSLHSPAPALTWCGRLPFRPWIRRVSSGPAISP